MADRWGGIPVETEGEPEVVTTKDRWGGIPVETEGEPAEQQQLSQIPDIGGSPRAQRGAQAKFQRQQENQLAQDFQAGKMTSQNLSDDEVELVQQKRIEAIPEIAQLGGIKKLSQNLGFKEALLAMTTFDPEEFSAILQKADPNIGVAMTPEGEHIAFNEENGEAFSINKVGPSLMDAFQVGVTGAIFAPTAALGGIPAIAAGTALTQAGIETGQALSGGEFDVEDVAIAGAAAPAVAAIKPIAQGVKKLGTTLANKGPLLEGLFKGESATKQSIRAAIETGEGKGNREAAGWIIDGFDNIKKDPMQIKAIKQGYDTGTVAGVTASNRATKNVVNDMADIAEQGLKDSVYQNKHRPTDAIGKVLDNRFESISALNREAGEALPAAVEGLKGKTVDLKQPFTTFVDDMKELGVNLPKDGGDLVFDTFSVAENPAAAKLLQNIVNKAGKIGGDATNAHQFKSRTIDEAVNFAKQDGTLLGKTERIVKKLRHGINQELHKVDETYKKVNTQFSDTRTALDTFQDAIGSTVELGTKNTHKDLGTVSRSLLSNNRSRGRLMTAFDDITEVNSKYGNTFDDNLDIQVIVADDLESLLGGFAKTSLQGEVKKSGGLLSRHGRESLLSDIAESTANKVTPKGRRINPENAIKALKNISRGTK